METGFVGENRTALRNRSAIDGGEAREGGVEGYSGRSLLLASQVNMIKRQKNKTVFANKPKHFGLVWFI